MYDQRRMMQCKNYAQQRSREGGAEGGILRMKTSFGLKWKGAVNYLTEKHCLERERPQRWRGPGCMYFNPLTLK